MIFDTATIRGILLEKLDNMPIYQGAAHRCSFEELVAHVRGHLNELQQSCNRLTDIHKSIQAADKEYEKRQSGFKSQIRALRSECPHFSTTYYPGASGNEGYIECNICGAKI